MGNESKTVTQDEIEKNGTKIKKITKFCEIMVTGDKKNRCREIHDEALLGKTNFKEFVGKMRVAFKTNKKFNKLITHITQKGGDV